MTVEEDDARRQAFIDAQHERSGNAWGTFYARPDGACWCETCDSAFDWWPRMNVCPDCGNKRCPRALWHEYACTDSNEPNQHGAADAGRRLTAAFDAALDNAAAQGPPTIYIQGSVLSEAELIAAWRDAVRNPGPIQVLGSEPEITPLPRCTSCVHWEPYDAGDVDAKGECHGLRVHGDHRDVAEAYGDFFTAPTFGCTEWEAKP